MSRAQRPRSPCAGRPPAILVQCMPASVGAIQPAARAAAGVSECAAAPLVDRRVENIRALRVDGDVVGAGIFVDVQRLLPGGAAIGAHVDAALLVRPPEVSLCRYVDDVRVSGIHYDPPDV